MEKFKNIYDDLRKKGLRITNQRKEIIDILVGRHLTFKEIRDQLAKRGYKNLATLYNNIDFLLEHEIIIEIYINGVKYYDLSIEEERHNADAHIHVKCRHSNTIVEISDDRIFDLIKEDPSFKNFNFEQVQIIINGTCKHHDGEICTRDGEACFLDSLSDIRSKVKHF